MVSALVSALVCKHSSDMEASHLPFASLLAVEWSAMFGGTTELTAAVDAMRISAKRHCQCIVCSIVFSCNLLDKRNSF